MKVTIIHKEGCPLCERAIREFADDGHEVELFESLQDVPVERRSDMMTNMLLCGADKDAFPQVFIYDRFISWKPKKGELHGNEEKGAWARDGFADSGEDGSRSGEGTGIDG